MCFMCFVLGGGFQDYMFCGVDDGKDDRQDYAALWAVGVDEGLQCST